MVSTSHKNPEQASSSSRIAEPSSPDSGAAASLRQVNFSAELEPAPASRFTEHAQAAEPEPPEQKHTTHSTTGESAQTQLAATPPAKQSRKVFDHVYRLNDPAQPELKRFTFATSVSVLAHHRLLHRGKQLDRPDYHSQTQTTVLSLAFVSCMPYVPAIIPFISRSAPRTLAVLGCSQHHDGRTHGLEHFFVAQQ